MTPTLKGLQGERLDFTSVIYFGIMLTDEGPQLLEYNVRLGDPETEVILPAMKSDLQLVLACSTARWQTIVWNIMTVILWMLSWRPAVIRKITSKAMRFTIVDQIAPDVLVFHAGTTRKDGKIVTSGGRVLNVAAHGSNLAETIDKVYQECRKIHFTDIYYRTDIAKRDAS